MQNNDSQTNNFRSATNLHALRRSRSDNRFVTATNLGSILANATRFSFRAKGTVGKSDKVDFYKFTVGPGVPITLYLKVERRTGETRYNIAFNFFR